MLAAALGCGCLFVATVAVLVLLGVWQFLSPTSGTASSPTAASSDVVPPSGPEPAEALSQTFATQNGLASVHYPADFAASTPNEHVVTVQRHAHAGAHYVVVDAIGKPVSEHLEEVDRIVRIELAKALQSFVATPVVKSTCHTEAGVASGGTYVEEGTTYDLRACAFMKSGKYYRCSYAAPKSEFASIEPLLKRICDGFDLQTPADQ
jgi:hypothetical protein